MKNRSSVVIYKRWGYLGVAWQIDGVMGEKKQESKGEIP